MINLTKNEKIQQLIFAICVFVILLAVIGRMVCGCHWFSDILGGIIVEIENDKIFHFGASNSCGRMVYFRCR